MHPVPQTLPQKAEFVSQKGCDCQRASRDVVRVVFKLKCITKDFFSWQLLGCNCLKTANPGYNGGCAASQPASNWNLIGDNNIQCRRDLPLSLEDSMHHLHNQVLRVSWQIRGP